MELIKIVFWFIVFLFLVWVPDWLLIINFINEILMKYQNILTNITEDEKQANFIFYASLIIIIQPVIICGFLLWRKKSHTL